MPKNLHDNVAGLFYCTECRKRRFALAIMKCSQCGKNNVRCPRWFAHDGTEWGICESCLSRRGICAKCGAPRARKSRYADTQNTNEPIGA